MLRNFLRQVILSRIEERGRAEGAPMVTFTEKEISVEGDEMNIGQGWVQWYFLISGFYLALPHNAYGVVVHPNGRLENMPGRMHEAPAGLYRLFYVDKQERSAVSSPVSEITTDGEKLVLKIIVRYQVDDPVVALGITNPVDTMMEHIETDVAQYIRTHKHTEIADSAAEQDSRLLSFFAERHNRREPLAKALKILGVELKEFMGDKDFVDMRRRALTNERQTSLTRQEEEHLQEINLLKAEYKVENEKKAAEHAADLERKAAEHVSDLEKKAAEHLAALEKSRAEHKAEKEKIEARHEKEMEGILRQVKLREIDLENKRGYLQTQTTNFSQVIEAITRAFSSGIPMNSSVIKNINDLFAAYKEDMDRVMQFEPSTKPRPAPGENAVPPVSPPTGSDKVEKLTNTLLNLLNPRK